MVSTLHPPDTVQKPKSRCLTSCTEGVEEEGSRGDRHDMKYGVKMAPRAHT